MTNIRLPTGILNVISIIMTCFITAFHNTDTCKLSHNILMLALLGIYNNFISTLVQIVFFTRNKLIRTTYRITTIILLIISFISSIIMINYFVSNNLNSYNYNNCDILYYYTVLCNCSISIIYMSMLCIYIVILFIRSICALIQIIPYYLLLRYIVAVIKCKIIWLKKKLKNKLLELKHFILNAEIPNH